MKNHIPELGIIVKCCEEKDKFTYRHDIAVEDGIPYNTKAHAKVPNAGKGQEMPFLLAKREKL